MVRDHWLQSSRRFLKNKWWTMIGAASRMFACAARVEFFLHFLLMTGNTFSIRQGDPGSICCGHLQSANGLEHDRHRRGIYRGGEVLLLIISIVIICLTIADCHNSGRGHKGQNQRAIKKSERK